MKLNNQSFGSLLVISSNFLLCCEAPQCSSIAHPLPWHSSYGIKKGGLLVLATMQTCDWITQLMFSPLPPSQLLERGGGKLERKQYLHAPKRGGYMQMSSLFNSGRVFLAFFCHQLFKRLQRRFENVTDLVPVGCYLGSPGYYYSSAQ